MPGVVTADQTELLSCFLIFGKKNGGKSRHWKTKGKAIFPYRMDAFHRS